MTELQQTRYDRLIRRVGGLIGPGSKVGEVISELFPMIDVENVPGELLLLGGTRLCIGSASHTGAAGERPRIQLFNPVDSQVLIAVSSVIISSLNSETVRWALTETQLPTGTGFQRFRDLRLPRTSLPTGGIFIDSLVAIVESDGQARILGGEPFTLEDGNSVAVLPPGSGMNVGIEDVADTFFATFYWRERSAEQSELNL